MYTKIFFRNLRTGSHFDIHVSVSIRKVRKTCVNRGYIGISTSTSISISIRKWKRFHSLCLCLCLGNSGSHMFFLLFLCLCLCQSVNQPLQKSGNTCTFPIYTLFSPFVDTFCEKQETFISAFNKICFRSPTENVKHWKLRVK